MLFYDRLDRFKVKKQTLQCRCRLKSWNNAKENRELLGVLDVKEDQNLLQYDVDCFEIELDFF